MPFGKIFLILRDVGMQGMQHDYFVAMMFCSGDVELGVVKLSRKVCRMWLLRIVIS